VKQLNLNFETKTPDTKQMLNSNQYLLIELLKEKNNKKSESAGIVINKEDKDVDTPRDGWEKKR